jgi:sarcosine oxidase gamma subunit
VTQIPTTPPPDPLDRFSFLSPARADASAVWRSPLERALADAPPGIRDISRTGKIEVCGEVAELRVDGVEAIWLNPQRALVLCDYDETAAVIDRVGDGFLTVDVSGALAGLEVEGAAVMRRLTDLDLDELPAPGPVAHVQAVVIRDEGERFRLFFPQEYGHYVAEVVVDALEGLRPR